FAASLPREGSIATLISAGVRRLTGGIRRQRLQRSLVVAQIAASVVLLAGAGLLTRTMIHLSEVDSGLKSEEVLAMDVPLLKLSGGPSNGDPAAWYKSILESDFVAKEQYDRMRREIRALPGVNEVGLGSTIPL